MYHQVPKGKGADGNDCIAMTFNLCDDFVLGRVEKDRTVRREFNRQIDIPRNVDPTSLRSSLNKHGVLQVTLNTTTSYYYIGYRERLQIGVVS